MAERHCIDFHKGTKALPSPELVRQFQHQPEPPQKLLYPCSGRDLVIAVSFTLSYLHSSAYMPVISMPFFTLCSSSSSAVCTYEVHLELELGSQQD